VDTIFTSLPGPAEVKAVALSDDGLLAGCKPGTAYFDLSTNSLATVKALHVAFKSKNVDMLDAPVSGGPVGAQSRKLALWVGGSRDVYQQNLPVLQSIGDAPRHIGDIGAGTVAKLVHNCAGYAINAALAEVFSLGVKAGVDPLDLWEAVSTGVLGRHTVLDLITAQFLPAKFDPPAFALRLAHKDVSLATALGRELNVPMRLANLTLEEMTEAMARDWGDSDSRRFMELQLERAGVTIAITPERIAEAKSRLKPPT
jgi:3-hydroxyisobutyrate dehydrogenase